MKINGNFPNDIGKLYQINQNRTAQTEKDTNRNGVGKDSLELSDQAKKINELVKQTKDLPEIREEKIARIKEEINNNTYNIPSSKIAAKMLSLDQE